MQPYRVSQKNATPKREEEKHRVATGILKGMNLHQMRLAIERADRKTKDRAGRQWKIGPKVAGVVVQLWFRDGQGEVGDGSIHNSGFAWKYKEGSLTERGLRTARRVGQEEGLFESWVGHRPGDRQRTVYYRLNVWEVGRVVARSELENVSTLLETEGRRAKREELATKREELRRTLKDLDMIDLGAEGEADLETGGKEKDIEEPSRVPTKCQHPYDTLSALHNTSPQHPEKEGCIDIHPKKDRRVSSISEEEAEARWEDLVEGSPQGRSLSTLAAILAEKNKTGKVSIRKVWRSLGLRYLAVREQTPTSEAAWAFGFEEAIDAEAPNIGYVMKAAKNYRPDNEAKRRSGKSLRPKGGLSLGYDE